jgi:integrase
VPSDKEKKIYRPQRNIITCAAKFQSDLVAESKKPRAIESYMGRVRNFLRFFEGREKHIDDITEDDIRDFLRWAQSPKHIHQRKGGHSNNTQRNHLRDISIFMRRFGVEMPLKTKFWPKAVPKPKRKYSVSSVNEMLKVAKTEDEKDFVHFLLNTGFRDDEAAHAQYGDIDFRKGSINVYAKPEYNWTPKNNKSREKDIVLGEKFLKRMKARKERNKAKSSDLIFPTSAGRPDNHLIRIVQRLIMRAGLDERASLHMFRKTFVTLVVNKRGLEQGRIWAGHDKVETTQAYIAADEMTTEQSRAVMEEIFSAVGD